MSIKQPKNSSGFTWSPQFAALRNAQIQRKQRYVDEEVLRRDEPLMPRKTGNMINSGRRGTRVGSGEVKYTASYSDKQYYETAESRPYDPNRGAHWFERMKTTQKGEIKKGMEKV